MIRPRSPEGRRLLEAVAALRQPYRCERSAKLVPGALLADRFLVSLPKTALGGGPLDRLRDLAGGLGLPAALARALADPLAAADTIHLGHEASADGGVHKLYLEFARAAREASEAEMSGTLVHLAFKWDPARPGRHSTAEYRLVQGRTVPDLRSGLAALCADTVVLAAGGAALDAALSRAAAVDLMLLAVSEPENGRLSYDLNLYEAGLPVGALAAPLAEAAARFGIAAAAADHFAAIAGERLGHVAGGLGRDGRPFLTIYHGGMPA